MDKIILKTRSEVKVKVTFVVHMLSMFIATCRCPKGILGLGGQSI